MKPGVRGILVGLCSVALGWGVHPCLADEHPHKAGEKPEAPPTAPAAAMCLADLEQMALANNPTLVQAASRIDAARGKARQAGLYPNPVVGYEGEQIGVAGTAGERQGGFIQQEIVTAGKLRLSRAKYQQEIVQAEIQLVAQQQRVVNGVRVRYWEVLVEQRRIEARRELSRLTAEAVKTVEELVNVGQANRPDLLQTQVEAARERAELQAAERRYLGKWQELAAVVGQPCLPPAPLAGDLAALEPAPDWDRTLCDLLEASPEMQIAQAEVVRDEIGLRRERVEPIPNVTLRAATGYNYESRDTTTDVTVSVRLPLFDRNQGTIRQAQAELTRARAEVTRVELSLRKRFADAAARYQAARSLVEAYRDEMLPKSREAYELLLDSFRKRRAAWPQVLVAARTYFETTVELTDALHDLRRAEVEVRGLLLMDGLTEPPGPTPAGHREAVPKPR